MPDLIQRIQDAYTKNHASALAMLPELFQAHDDGWIAEFPCEVIAARRSNYHRESAEKALKERES